MGYFLVVDKAVLKYSNDFNKVLNTLADMYGGRVSVEYYGLISKKEILEMDYMDMHEGCYFFIAGLKLVDSDNKTDRDISISIYDSGYLMEYVDDEDSDGYTIIEWLKANKERYWLDYSKSGIKKYCVMVEETFEGSFDTLKEAYDFLKNDNVYGNLKVMAHGDGTVFVRDTGLGDLERNKGYYEIAFNVVNEQDSVFNISIIELDSVFNHFHRSNARSLAWHLDRDRSSYSLNIIDYAEVLGEACKILISTPKCKGCYELQEKGCPIAEEWKKYLSGKGCE